MEKDDDWQGEGNEYHTEFRQLDVRLGRWMSPEPMMSVLPGHSPYEVNFNNPIVFTDPLGLLPTGGDPPTGGRKDRRRNRIPTTSRGGSGGGFKQGLSDAIATIGDFVSVSLSAIDKVDQVAGQVNETVDFAIISSSPGAGDPGVPSKYILVVINHGFVFDDEGDGKYESVKGSGGELGGHVMVYFPDEDESYGFSGKTKFRPRYKPEKMLGSFGRGNWDKDIGGEHKKTVFAVPVTSDTYEGMYEFYSYWYGMAVVNFEKRENGGTKDPVSPYDYAIIGKRCTSSALTLLQKFGALPKQNRIKNIFRGLFPRTFLRYMKKLAKKNDWFYEIPKYNNTDRYDKKNVKYGF